MTGFRTHPEQTPSNLAGYTSPKTVTPVSHPRRSQVPGILPGSDNALSVNYSGVEQVLHGYHYPKYYPPDMDTDMRPLSEVCSLIL